MDLERLKAHCEGVIQRRGHLTKMHEQTDRDRALVDEHILVLKLVEEVQFYREQRENHILDLAKRLFAQSLYVGNVDSTGNKALEAIQHADRFFKTWHSDERGE